MTNGLGDAYGATIQRIKAQGGDRARLGVEALMWISHSERLLSVDEICQALAVEIGSTEIYINNVPSIRTVLGCCQGLAVVDKGSSTIRLIHSTLKEHLSHRAGLFDRPHSKIAETCLTYLNSRAIKDLSVSPSSDPRGTPFLEYSSLYWGIHMRMELSDLARSLAHDLFDQYDSHVSAKLLSRSTGEWPFKYDKPFSALHCVSYLGIAEVAIGLIKTKKWDVNERDSAGLTPLMWAARYGHKEVVKLLLEQKNTQPDISDTRYGRTALSWAAGSGCEGVIRLFLSRPFVNPGSLGRRLGAPQVMDVIIGRKYINPDGPDSSGRTLLSWAAGNGHDGVVKLLLERGDARPDRQDHDSRTPLSWAASNGHDGVVKLLLGREGVNPDRLDKNGRTPLSLAAWGGHDGVMNLLLGWEGVSPDTPDNGGRTPLSLAAGNGHDGVVELLLGWEGVSPDTPDNDNRTPLSWASWNEYDGVAKLLLERRDVTPDRQDDNGRTPLSWAATGGYDGAVKRLLERKDVNPDMPDNNGRTPLSRAAGDGCDITMKMLL